MENLALHGGEPAITFPHPHEVWPPAASPTELTELAAQRNIDINSRRIRADSANSNACFSNSSTVILVMR